MSRICCLIMLTMLCSLGAVPVESARAQIVRSPEMKLQYHRAERAWRSGTSLHEARARLDEVIKVQPADGDAYLLRARVFLELGDSDAALIDARRAVALDPESGAAHLVLCEAARISGEVTEALSALGTAARLITNDAEAHVRLSWNALALGAVEEAEAFARVAVAMDNRLPAAYRQLAHVFLQEDRAEDAAKTLARGLRDRVLTQHMLESDPLLLALAAHPAVVAAISSSRPPHR